jgi:hypothetical protein
MSDEEKGEMKGMAKLHSQTKNMHNTALYSIFSFARSRAQSKKKVRDFLDFYC